MKWTSPTRHVTVKIESSVESSTFLTRAIANGSYYKKVLTTISLKLPKLNLDASFPEVSRINLVILLLTANRSIDLLAVRSKVIRAIVGSFGRCGQQGSQGGKGRLGPQ